MRSHHFRLAWPSSMDSCMLWAALMVPPIWKPSRSTTQRRTNGVCAAAWTTVDWAAAWALCVPLRLRTICGAKIVLSNRIPETNSTPIPSIADEMLSCLSFPPENMLTNSGYGKILLSDGNSSRQRCPRKRCRRRTSTNNIRNRSQI